MFFPLIHHKNTVLPLGVSQYHSAISIPAFIAFQSTAYLRERTFND
jgi:hypothetical protein